MFSLKAQNDFPFLGARKRHDTNIRQIGNIASRLVAPACTQAACARVCVCVCVYQHLLLYLLLGTIATITDVQASKVCIDRYCSTLFCISRKSLTF